MPNGTSPDSQFERLRQLERRAKAKRLGAWAKQKKKKMKDGVEIAEAEGMFDVEEGAEAAPGAPPAWVEDEEEIGVSADKLPNRPTGAFLRAESFVNRELFEDAEIEMRKLVRRFPEHPQKARIEFYLALSVAMQERYEEAVAAFDRALELEPRNAGLRFNRGEACRRAGRSAEAKADLEAVLEIEGESPDLLLALGLVAYEADDFEEAAGRYERALVLKADFPEAWNDLGVVKFRSGDYAAARAAFGRAVEQKADFADAWLNLADALDELGLRRERDAAAAKAKLLGARGEE